MVYINTGASYIPAKEEDAVVVTNLPPAIYTLKFSPMRGFFLEKEKEKRFNLPKKLYGDLSKNCERVINTFSIRDKSTGVLLCGEKGSGKTLLTKLICNQLLEQNYPVVLVNSSFQDMDNEFQSVILGLQECVVLFDEFEKVFPIEQYEGVNEQSKLLTLLDGISTNKKLFLLTANDKSKIDKHLLERPSRIFYNFRFEGLDEKFIKQYCKKNCKKETYTKNILANLSQIKDINFDMLMAIVEEMNRYDCSFEEVYEILNIRPNYSNSFGETFVARFFLDGKLVAERTLNDFDPFRSAVSVPDKLLDIVEETEEDGYTHKSFMKNHIVDVNHATGTFTYRMPNKKHKVELVLTLAQNPYSKLL